MLFKYSGKYVKIYFNMKITFLPCFYSLALVLILNILVRFIVEYKFR